MNGYHWPQLLQELPQASASAEGSASGAASRATMSLANESISWRGIRFRGNWCSKDGGQHSQSEDSKETHLDGFDSSEAGIRF